MILMINQSQSLFPSIAYGAIGGFIAGIAIIPLIMLTGFLSGFSESAILFALGMAFGSDPENAITIGASAHILISILIGVAFGLLTYKIKKLSITSIKKSVTEGIGTGIIVFIVMFTPLSLVVIPSVIVGIVKETNLGITEQQIAVNFQQSIPMVLGTGAIGYTIYGMILGVIVAILLRSNRSTGDIIKW
jgi:hypothetical protein